MCSVLESLSKGRKGESMGERGEGKEGRRKGGRDGEMEGREEGREGGKPLVVL